MKIIWRENWLFWKEIWINGGKMEYYAILNFGQQKAALLPSPSTHRMFISVGCVDCKWSSRDYLKLSRWGMRSPACAFGLSHFSSTLGDWVNPATAPVTGRSTSQSHQPAGIRHVSSTVILGHCWVCSDQGSHFDFIFHPACMLVERFHDRRCDVVICTDGFCIPIFVKDYRFFATVPILLMRHWFSKLNFVSAPVKSAILFKRYFSGEPLSTRSTRSS